MKLYCRLISPSALTILCLIIIQILFFNNVGYAAATDAKADTGAAPIGAPPVDAAVVLGAINAPPGTLVEAESRLLAGDMKVIEDAAASGGKAVSASRDWQPVAAAKVPAQGDAFKVWVRHKYGPFVVKSVMKGQQKELKWNWNKPEGWAWTDMGVYSREDLGEEILVVRSAKNPDPDPIIDAVVFSPDKIRPLPPFEPDKNAAPLTIRASVDWNTIVGKMPPAIWGVNDYEILDPKAAGDKGFQDLLGQLRFPLIRIHNAGIVARWADEKTRAWDVEKIKAGFAASTGYGNAKIMLNIADYPKWMNEKDGVLDPADEDAYADFIAQLVRIMRDDVRRPIDYWEFTNEKDNAYEKAGKLDDLWRMLNKIAAAIKQVDPQAKVGGPALTWAKPLWVEGFLKNCGPNMHFITWHNYGTGDIYETNETLFDKANAVQSLARGVKEAVAKYVPNRKFEMFLTEMNVKWTWDPFERRHANNVGAVFHATVLRRVALEGIDGVAHWHVKGNAYGMIDGENKLRAPYHLYRWGTQYLSGNIASSKSDDEKSLEVLPVINTDRSRSLLLINKANRAVTVPNGKLLLVAANGQRTRIMRIDASGYSASTTSPVTNDFVLPGYSLTLLTTAD